MVGDPDPSPKASAGRSMSTVFHHCYNNAIGFSLGRFTVDPGAEQVKLSYYHTSRASVNT